MNRSWTLHEHVAILVNEVKGTMKTQRKSKPPHSRMRFRNPAVSRPALACKRGATPNLTDPDCTMKRSRTFETCSPVQVARLTVYGEGGRERARERAKERERESERERERETETHTHT